MLYLLKKAAADLVDVVMILIVLALGWLDLFSSYDLSGSTLFAWVYCLALLIRKTYWQDVSTHYITDPEDRIRLRLPVTL